MFDFITVLPASVNMLNENPVAPHINIAIYHEFFGSYDTKFYFPDHILNENDAMLNSLDEFNRELIISELVPVNYNNLDEGYFMLVDIIIDGISAYRKN